MRAPSREHREDGTYVERDQEEAAAAPRRAAPVAPPPSGERYVDYEDGPQVAGGFRVGQRVRHEKFGEGRVRQLLGSGHGLLLMVDFPGIGEIKKVVARFIQPA